MSFELTADLAADLAALKNPEMPKATMAQKNDSSSGTLFAKAVEQAKEPEAITLSPLQKMMLKNTTGNFVLGNPNGTHEVAVFMDYNCGHCRKEIPELLELARCNPEAKIVLKNSPILAKRTQGASQEAAHMSAMMAQFGNLTPQQTRSFLNKISQSEERLDGQGIRELYQQVGGDLKNLEQNLNNSDRVAQTEGSVNQNYRLFKELKLRGTPTLVINGKIQ
jgi:protein-disulfide isomerase